MPDVCRGHRDVFGEASIAIDADDLRVWTDMRVAGATQQASTVDNMSFSGDAITFAYVGDEFADLNDVTGEFVSDDDGRFHASLRPRVPVVDVYVGSAHAGAAHANQNFIVSNRWLRDVLQNETRS